VEANTMDAGQVIAWSAVVSTIAAIAAFLTGILCFARGGLSGMINDAVSVVQLLFMIPLTYAMFAISRQEVSVLAGIASVMGLIGTLVAGTYQALLVFRVLSFEQAGLRSLTAGGAIGL
jgi:hypothetical protein